MIEVTKFSATETKSTLQKQRCLRVKMSKEMLLQPKRNTGLL